MDKIRKIIFWTHLSAALVAGTVIFLMSATGVILMYEKQMLAEANARSARVSPPESGATASAERVLAAVAKWEGPAPTSLTIRRGPAVPYEVAFGREKTLFVDPYTGESLGEGAVGLRTFFRKVTELHRYIATTGENRPIGKGITGVCNLLFLYILVSGIYLWWPRRWSRVAWANALLFRRGLSGRARDFNWHNVIGGWTVLPLILIVASATVFSYPWANNLVYRAFGETPPARRGGGGGGSADLPFDPAAEGLDHLIANLAAAAPGWRSISVPLPVTPGEPVTFSLDAGTGGQPQKRSKITLDWSGAVVARETFADGTPGARARSILRFTHTGEVAGILGQTIAGLASLGAAVLVVTGYSLAIRRLRRWRQSR